ncbi:hypothetical protein HMPREF3115_23370 [Burkholderia sp. HMSC10F09]|nr:hypothetical protein HMPREF3115_23370 [Burkholderia sp. HMSC10F09]
MSYRIESKSRAAQRGAAIGRCGRAPADLNTTNGAVRNRHPQRHGRRFSRRPHRAAWPERMRFSEIGK